MSKYKVTVREKTYEVDLLSKKETCVCFLVEGEHYSVNVEPLLERATHQAPSVTTSSPASSAPSAAAGEVIAPMPGIIVQIEVNVGDTVQVGETLLVMEAMKMENNITAPASGAVKEIFVKQGQEVQNAQVLVKIE